MTGSVRRKPETRLANSAGIGDLLREANREFAGCADEAAAFRKLSERLSTSSVAHRGLSLLLPVATVAVLGSFALLSRTSLQAELEPRAVAEVPRTLPSVRLAASGEAAQKDSVRPLSSGTHGLGDGSSVTLGPGSTARVHEDADATRVTLASGSIDLEVTKQTEGRHFEVLADAYRFQVLGTQFKVKVNGPSVSLEVKRGRVAVWKTATLLARVSAGERWESQQALPPASSASSSNSAAPSARTRDRVAQEGTDCLSLARQGSTRDAEQCFLERAAGAGIGAEMALYEVARLRRDVLHDPNASLRTLDEYRQRFPNGSLRREADMSYLDLLVQLGRSREALDQSNAMLASGSGKERVSELRLLRGDILRRNLGDLPGAEREYAIAEQLTGAASSEATYLRGVCLEALGERARAADAFERYLQKPARPHAEEARSRLDSLRTP